MVDKYINLQVHVDPEVKLGFKEKYHNSMGQVIEGLMRSDLGWDDPSQMSRRRTELNTMMDEARKEIKEIDKTIKKETDKKAKQLKSIWKDFRKTFNVKQERWKGDHDKVPILERAYGIIMTYDDLYKVWDKMEGK